VLERCLVSFSGIFSVPEDLCYQTPPSTDTRSPPHKIRISVIFHRYSLSSTQPVRPPQRTEQHSSILPQEDLHNAQRSSIDPSRTGEASGSLQVWITSSSFDQSAPLILLRSRLALLIPKSHHKPAPTPPSRSSQSKLPSSNPKIKNCLFSSSDHSPAPIFPKSCLALLLPAQTPLIKSEERPSSILKGMWILCFVNQISSLMF